MIMMLMTSGEFGFVQTERISNWIFHRYFQFSLHTQPSVNAVAFVNPSRYFIHLFTY